ncbi:MAG: phospho-N-acetylmuramoyl-pentapeptide-transferase [Crocinitomicaceae bacterium]|jgi:phospho-N-acetylmuramoyl-pentapeptide-transferase|nr:phospho-N-acetylmuramoyl-pentapeptide-transferase [Crocinitomicaceae bacterium]MDP4724046.1 phospho-N-acetylmuramoyl-pentapeptide-transferase [Crocinitomicaceae bacterium]MDP4739272.1 phospho-N-acetylmuramoyl-pentapeptide-transferase [Crocinitomicaceae bacterium]MDP4799537.1 phospho-N-acetylmuramoyl-pentapeptide-transferase [Crocinitomicaceae bacterium]MDP4805505.1 phospho-N-acetylmuramoyl-pentapeptide-transferase [Crocinitomicaceae bacterium]
MLYYLFSWLDQLNFPGAGLFQFISFRASLALITSLIVSVVIGKQIIDRLRRQQIGETVRDLGLAGQIEKSGTPTMGGLIILAAILIPTLLFAKLQNVYVVTMLIATVWLGLIGFLDDYIKVFKKNKEGLKGTSKIIGQIGVGLIVGGILYFSNDVVVHKRVSANYKLQADESFVTHEHAQNAGENYKWIRTDDMTTTIPFFKGNEFNYNWLIGDVNKSYGWLIFIPIVIFIVIAVSNGANMTDGLDGLATGTSAIVGLALAVLAYVSSHAKFADYLNVMYIPEAEELVIFIAAFVGACVGFLWYNAYPAQVFMGDTGSLALGGIIAVFAIAIRKELLIPVLCGIFLIENVSVMLQVGYFKFTKRQYGEGRRIFLMAPLHHHYQKKGIHEAKIVARFWIIAVLLAVVTIVTLKLR